MELVPDSLWERVKMVLPEEPPKPKGGRPRVDDRLALAGIMFILRTGSPWRFLPKELGCSPMTAWRRLRDWYELGVLEDIFRMVLYELGKQGSIDWSRAALDASNVPAKGGALKRSGRTPPIAADRAASTISSWIARARRSPSR